MKKIIAIILVLCTISLCGCSFMPSAIIGGNNIETLKGWSFQSNPGANDYSLFFGLLTKDGIPVSANIDVDIRIVNDSGEEVYSATRSVTPDDFGNYESQAAGSEFLANIRIPSSDIKNGKSDSGTVYLTVHNDFVSFDEVNCKALYCLPISDIAISAEGLPAEVKIKDYYGDSESVLKITDISYVYEKDYSQRLTITVYGEKTYGKRSIYGNYDIFSYKIYDSNGYVVNSGSIYLDQINAGEKFKKEDITVYDLTPDETYTIKFSE